MTRKHWHWWSAPCSTCSQAWSTSRVILSPLRLHFEGLLVSESWTVICYCA
ncbi:hypothetical protein I3843_06G091300 [Carya illinoinensis]|nr:hypothetical protein I3760_06G098000 [Carya illinoinensis]KAG7975293.1 hypothetical protein I3843_06G091300 [Carya illinoinensis]